MKFKVLRDCYGYKGRYWKADDIVEFAENDMPPSHFLALGVKPVLVEDELKPKEAPIETPVEQPEIPAEPSWTKAKHVGKHAKKKS